MADYELPVAALLTYGDCQEIQQRYKNPERDRLLKEALADGLESISREKLATIPRVLKSDTWPNYVEELGFTEEHVPDLIRMATDREFDELSGEDIEVWAPVHAWRSLGFLRAAAAVEPLLVLWQDEDFDDWIMDEVPWVMGMIGEGAIAPVSLYLASRKHPEWGRSAAIAALEYIAKLYPMLKETCIKKIGSQLADFRNNSEALNGFLVSGLVELEAVAKANLIERAYASGNVDESICGNWPNVQIDMGLATKEEFHPSELEPNFEWVRDVPPRRKPAKPAGLELPTKKLNKRTSQTSGFGVKSEDKKGKKSKKKRK